MSKTMTDKLEVVMEGLIARGGVLDDAEMYDRFIVEIRLEDKLLGGTPRTAEMVKGWLQARGMADKVDETLTEVELVETRERVWSGFKVDEVRGHYIETRQVKAMIKECAKLLGITLSRRGSKQILQHALLVFPHELYDPERRFDFDRIYIRKPSDEEIDNIERCGHVNGPAGPRSILKCNDFVEGVTLSFQVHVLKKQGDGAQTKFREKELKLSLTLAQNNGLGASRSQGYGRFTVTKFDKIAI